MTSIFKVTSTDDPILEGVYEQAMKELDKFFQINWKINRPNVFLVKDRKTIDDLRGEKTPKWLVGWTGGNTIYVLDKDAYLEDSSHEYSDESYRMLIKHELAHSFFKVVTGFKTQPKWLWEGVSILASGQAEVWNKPKKFEGFLDNENVYQEAGYALYLLVNKYGHDSLVKLLKAYKTYKGSISELFEKNFGEKLEYQTFNNLINS